MKKRKASPPREQQKAQFAHQPFRGLKQITLPAAKPVAPPAPPPPPAPVVVDEQTLFLEAVADARPLTAIERARVEMPAPASAPRAITDEEAEALAELSDLVTGNAPFDISDSDEYVEGHVVGIDPRLVRRLRRGELAYQAHLDLHHMTRDQARAAIGEFLSKAYQQDKRCVLIIHGRGRNSKDQIPVLKGLVTGWLARSQWSRLVLAFTSARPCDGGTGALYVLLRRQRHTRQPFRVTNGAKL